MNAPPQVRDAIEQRLTERLSELRVQADAGGPGAGAARARLEAIERSGQLLPAEQRAVAMSTRAGKGEGRLETAGDLDRAWWETARGHDFDARSVQALLHERAPAVKFGAAGGHELEQQILSRLTEFDARSRRGRRAGRLGGGRRQRSRPGAGGA